MTPVVRQTLACNGNPQGFAVAGSMAGTTPHSRNSRISICDSESSGTRAPAGRSSELVELRNGMLKVAACIRTQIIAIQRLEQLIAQRLPAPKPQAHEITVETALPEFPARGAATSTVTTTTTAAKYFYDDDDDTQRFAHRKRFAEKDGEAERRPGSPQGLALVGTGQKAQTREQGPRSVLASPGMRSRPAWGGSPPRR